MDLCFFYLKTKGYHFGIPFPNLFIVLVPVNYRVLFIHICALLLNVLFNKIILICGHIISKIYT
uniref:Uncharacterized protein n=1 Tax=Anguilla anguilla TaxID=7936 RepID=A0A0E9TVG9_ANGAN